MKRGSSIAWVLALGSWLGACQSKGPAVPYATLNEGFEPLRAAFNAGAGGVRILMLVSPT